MSSAATPSAPLPPLTTTQWLVIVIASIGFAFDIYELLMLPLIAGPAVAELLQVPPDNPLVRQWIGFMFWVTAVAGGVFGLMGGWLTDKLGRKFVLALSIFVYSLSPVAAAFSTSVEMLVFFRCTTFIGVCVEFVAAITWLAELFPEPSRREKVLGGTQAFSSLGGLMVTAASYLCGIYASSLPALPLPPQFDGHAPWRYTLMTGLLPAIPILILLPFVPESPIWLAKRRAGTLKRPSVLELFQPALLRTTIVSTILFACAYGAAFGALQQTPTQIVPGLPELKEQRAALAPLRKEAEQLNIEFIKTEPGSPEREELAQALAENRKKQAPYVRVVKETGEMTQFWQEIGGLLGRIALAFLAVMIVSRKLLLWVFVLPGLVIMPLTYGYAAHNSAALLQFGVALCGFMTVAQFSFWGNYLPRVFPIHLRGTGEGFAANVGGRMIGTSAAFLTLNIVAPMMPAELTTFAKNAYAAAIVGGGVFLLAFLVSFLLPEPRPETDD